MSSNFLMDDRCFACGTANEQGLQLEIIEVPTGVKTRIRLSPNFQGYTRIVHGGIVSTILDEVAVWAAFKKGYRSKTAEINVRFKMPMHTEEEYDAFGAVTGIKYNLIHAASEIKDEKNRIVAAAVVKLLKID